MAGDTNLSTDSELTSLVIDEFRKLELKSDVELAATSLIFKILDNITNHPDEAKYRTVKRVGGAYQSKILLNGDPDGLIIEQILLIAGFVLEGFYFSSSGRSYDAIQLPADVTVEALKQRRHLIEHLLQRNAVTVSSSSASSSTTASSVSSPAESSVVLSGPAESSLVLSGPAVSCVPSTPSASPTASSAAAARRIHEPAHQKLGEDLKALRESQAERFRERRQQLTAQGSLRRSSDMEGDENNDNERQSLTGGTRSRNGTGIGRFFSSLFGGNQNRSGSTNNDPATSRGARIRTMADIPSSRGLPMSGG